jgi:hypothetical protein
MKLRNLLIVAADPAIRVAARQALRAYADALFECPPGDLDVHARGLEVEVAVLIGTSSRPARAKLSTLLDARPAARVLVASSVAAAKRAVLRHLRAHADRPDVPPKR